MSFLRLGYRKIHFLFKFFLNFFKIYFYFFCFFLFYIFIYILFYKFINLLIYCYLVWGLNYVSTVLHLFFYKYLQTQAKNNEKEENSSDGLAEAG